LGFRQLDLVLQKQAPLALGRIQEVAGHDNLTIQKFAFGLGLGLSILDESGASLFLQNEEVDLLMLLLQVREPLELVLGHGAPHLGQFGGLDPDSKKNY